MCSVLLSVLPVKTDYLRDADWLLKYPTNQQKGYEKLTQTTKRSTPPERALKTKLETRVRLFVLPVHTPSANWLDLSTANQNLSNNRFLLATPRAK